MILFSNIPNNWQTKTGDNPWSNASSNTAILKFLFLLPNLGISWASECLKRWISENYSCFSSFTPKQVTNLKWWWSMTKCTLYNAKTKISTFGSKFEYFWAPWGSQKGNFKKSLCLSLTPPHNNLQTPKQRWKALKLLLFRTKFKYYLWAPEGSKKGNFK